VDRGKAGEVDDQDEGAHLGRHRYFILSGWYLGLVLGWRRPRLNPGKIEDDVQHQRKKSQHQKQMGQPELLVLVGDHIYVHLARQVRRGEVRLVGLRLEDPDGKAEACEPENDGKDEKQDEQPIFCAFHHQALFQLAERDGGEVDRLKEAGDGDELLCGFFFRVLIGSILE